MGHAYSLRQGDSGQEVRRLQASLGMPVIDGRFGPKTDNLLREFQKKSGLVVDGIAGPRTLRTLGIEVLCGIDVSHYQGKISWPTVKDDGVSFVFVKSSQNVSYTDPMFIFNVKLARAAGLPVGAYHFATPGRGNDPEKEANHFLNTVSLLGDVLDLAPVLDLETNPNGLGPDEIQDWALEWIRIVDSTIRKRTILYTGIGFLRQKTHMDGAKKLADKGVRLWVARYHGTDKKDPVTPGYPIGKFSEWTMWQFDQAGSVDGIETRVDRNWLPGGVHGLDDLKK